MAQQVRPVRPKPITKLCRNLAGRCHRLAQARANSILARGQSHPTSEAEDTFAVPTRHASLAIRFKVCVCPNHLWPSPPSDHSLTVLGRFKGDYKDAPLTPPARGQPRTLTLESSESFSHFTEESRYARSAPH